jgi:hypothetical protein
MGRSLQKEITQLHCNNAFQLSYIKCSCLKFIHNIHKTVFSCLPYIIFPNHATIPGVTLTFLRICWKIHINIFHFLQKTYLDLLWPQSLFCLVLAFIMFFSFKFINMLLCNSLYIFLTHI